MAVARRYQEPRSIILGRVVRPGEPRWLAEDRAWATEYEDYLAGICGGCGTPRSAWTGAKEGELPFVGVVHSCRGCEEKHDTEEEIPEEKRKPFRQVVMEPAGVYDFREELDAAHELLAQRRVEVAEAAERLGLPMPDSLAPVAVG